jgi:hypothetical protein
MPGFGTGGFGGQAGLYNSVSKLIDHALIATGINTDDEVYRERALTFANFAYLKVLGGRHWKFAQREVFLDLKAPYETDNVLLTQGSEHVVPATVDDVPVWDATMEGMLFVPATGGQYRIEDTVSATDLKLSVALSEDTVAASAYRILYDRFSLEAAVQGVRSVSVNGIGEIRPIGRQEFFNLKSANPGLTGVPKFYTLVNQESDTGQWTLEVFPAPDRRYTACIEYSVRPLGLDDEDDCYLLIPPEYTHTVYFEVLSMIYAHQENPVMSDKMAKEAAIARNTMASDQEMTDSRARIQNGGRYFTRGRRRMETVFYGLDYFGKVEA